MIRFFAVFAFGLGLVVASAAAQDKTAGKEDFNVFLRELWPDAQARGITRRTFDSAFAGLTPDPRVIAITRRQPEYNKPIGPYIASFGTPGTIATGLRKASEWRATLDAIEKTYGVDRWFLLAIWGMETSYGGYQTRWDMFRSLATLAHARYRHPYFRNELIVALEVLQRQHVPRAKMLSSWAGAMGQPQFMPSSFLNYAVDVSGDGHSDIWTNVPDVLGSIANYLARQGWKPGLTWGFEVTVPKDFDYRHSRGSYADWARLGVRRVDGKPYPATGDAILFFPSGVPGPAFLATDNYSVLKLYNISDAYVLALGHLADRLRGLPASRAVWPADEQPLPREHRMGLQRKLADLGYTVRDFEGRIDFDLRDSIRDVQVKFGMLPDGHPTAALLDRLGVKRP